MQYLEGFRDITGLKMITYDEAEQCNFQYIVLEIDESLAGINRDLLIDVLHAENVLARRYFHPGCHKMEPYRSHFPHAGLLLPETERLIQRVMCLPTGTTVSPADVGKICCLIRLVIENSHEIRTRLANK